MSRFLSVHDLAHLPPPKWLIEGMFEVGSLVMLVGPPASYKSFLALDWMLNAASHRNWQGRATTPSKVLYLLGEGKSSLYKRIMAWQNYNQLDREAKALLDKNFRVSFEVPQMADKVNFNKFLSALTYEEFQPDVIVIDTLARSFVGKDENSQQDAGCWVESADFLRQKFGTTVLAIHHTKKNTEFGLQYRGSSALQGAMDSAFVLEKDPEVKNVVKLVCSKQKDHDEGQPQFFERVIVDPGSIVLVPTIKPSEVDRAALREEEAKIDTMIAELLSSKDYESNRARARELAKRTNRLEGWAYTRIARAARQQPTDVTGLEVIE